MSDYVKATNFAAKDNLPVGDANKKVKGTEIDNEFNLISDAIETKADLNSPDLTGTPSAPTAASGTETTQIATTAFVQTVAVPSGAVFHFAMTTAPTGYLLCDGSAVSRTTYADLFTAIGTTFGEGDGSTTFALPDLVGQFIRGYNADASVGVDAGRTFGSTQQDAIVEHDHFMTRNNATSAGDSHNGESTLQSGYYNYDFVQTGAAQEGLCGGYVEANNSGGCQNFSVGQINRKGPSASTETSTDEVRPVNVALLPCIKT